MALKLDGMSPKELETLIRDAQARMASARTTHVASVRSKIDGILKAEGLQLVDVYPIRGGKTGKRAGAGVPKYQNPANPSQTWTGHGKKPAWFLAALKKPGTTEASLQIGGRAPTAKAAPRKIAKRAKKKVAK
jgi:DNA-binding protein H-NS